MNVSLRRLPIIPLLTVLCLLTTRAIGDVPASVMRSLDKYQIPAASVSMVVRDLESGRTVLSLNADQPRNPASVIKLLTTLAALEILGPAHSWDNAWLASGPIRRGKLDGDLVFRGAGDPFLTVDSLLVQLLALRQAGIEKITGDLVIDNSLFALPPHDRAAFDSKPSRLYNVGPDAALMNFSATRFVFEPRDGRIEIYADPPLHKLEIDNSVQPQAGKCSNRNVGWRYQLARGEERVTARFSGNYRPRCGTHSFSRSLFDNPEYAWRLFREMWETLGGEIRGHYRVDVTPDNATELVVRPSQTLADIITGINKFSNNVMARMLLLAIGVEMHERPGTVESGILGVRRWLSASGMPMPELVLENGSGLSRQGRVSANSLTELLRHGWHSTYRPEFVSSLPLAAIDGTMRKRLNDTGLFGRARIKTGLINGVRSMAGYVHARDDRHYSVVMMIDTRKVNYWNGNAVQDSLLQWIYDR